MRSKSKYPAIDGNVLELFCSVRKLRGSKKTSARFSILDKCSCSIRSQIKRCDQFKDFNGWFSHWQQTYRIRNSVHRHDEAADIGL